MLDLDQNYLQKIKKKMGRKGCITRLQDSDTGWKLPSDYLQITPDFPLFSVSQTERMK